MLSKYKYFPQKLLICLIFLIWSFFTQTASVSAQSGTLQDVTDFVNDTTSGAFAEHTISFTLPLNAAPIRTTDYIQVNLAAYSNITAPTYISGPYGVGPPVFSVSGTRARTTGITVIPGNTLVIHGITAKSPQLESMYRIEITITQDAAGTIIKNYGNAFVQLYSPYLARINVTAFIDIPQSRLVIEGYTAPSTFITFTENNTVTGTDTSGLNGRFSHIFSGVMPGSHQVSFYGADPNLLTTTPIFLDVYLPAFQEISVTGLLLSPTLTLNKASYYLGEPIVVSGTALPNGSITIFTEAPLRTYSTTANALGVWSYTISNSDEYVLGDYYIHALVQDGIGTTSLHSPSAGFSMRYTGGVIGTACGDIEHGDLNCDTLIDLTDFSILMYYWGTNSAVADINQDLRVNLTDFSIIMYYWGT